MINDYGLNFIEEINKDIDTYILNKYMSPELRIIELKNWEEDCSARVGGISISSIKFSTISLSDNFLDVDKSFWRVLIFGYIRIKEKKDRIFAPPNPFDNKNRKVQKS